MKRLVLRDVAAGAVGDGQDDDNHDDDPNPVPAGHRELHLLTASGRHPGDAQAYEYQQDDSVHLSALRAQAGAVAVLAHEDNRGKIPFFAGIDDCRFKRIVEPGDVLTLECEFVRVRGPIAKGEGRATVNGEVAAEALLTVFVGE